MVLPLNKRSLLILLARGERGLPRAVAGRAAPHAVPSQSQAARGGVTGRAGGG